MDQLVLFFAVGFAAQLVDGAIGMAYGLTSTIVLLSLGIPPATASASVQAAEVFTTGASGLAHWRFRNVDFTLLRRLALPGMVGGAIGAYVLATSPAEAIRLVITAYLLVMGWIILRKALRRAEPTPETLRHVALLGLTADGRLLGADGRVYAHGTSTCLIFPL